MTSGAGAPSPSALPLAEGEPTPEVLDPAGIDRIVTAFTCLDEAEMRARVAQARRDGFVISNQQLMLQELVVAAAVIGPDRKAIAAISMPVYMPEWNGARVREELVPVITETARAISSIISQDRSRAGPARPTPRNYFPRCCNRPSESARPSDRDPTSDVAPGQPSEIDVRPTHLRGEPASPQNDSASRQG